MSTQSMTYTQAVALAKEGKQTGFQFLYESTYKNQYYIALKYMKNEDAAMDIVQDAYVQAFAKLDTLQDPEKFPGWMGRIVANYSKNELVKKNPILFSEMANEEEEGLSFEYQLEDESVQNQPELAYTAKETQELVHEMLDALSDDQRMCVLMFHLEGMSIHEIAETLGCSENTVKSRLNYGRNNIKKQAEELKKKGVKLYSAAPLTFLLLLLRAEAECTKIPQALATGKALADAGYITVSEAVNTLESEIISQAGKKVAKSAGKNVLRTTAGKVMISIIGTVTLIGVVGVSIFFGTGGSGEDEKSEKETVALEATATPTATSPVSMEEELLLEYLQTEFIDQYGIFDYEQNGTATQVRNEAGWFDFDEASNWVQTKGVVAAEILDLQGDGKKELSVFVFTPDENLDINANLTWYVCSIENDTVVTKVNKSFGNLYSQSTDESECYIGKREIDSKVQYFVVFANQPFGYGRDAMDFRFNLDVAECSEKGIYVKGKYEYSQIAQGIGTIYDEHGNIVQEEILYDATEVSGIGEGAVENMSEFFSEYGISIQELEDGVTGIMKNDYNKTTESDSEDMKKIFFMKIYSEDGGQTEEGGEWHDYILTATDGTGFLDNLSTQPKSTPAVSENQPAFDAYKQFLVDNNAENFTLLDISTDGTPVLAYNASKMTSEHGANEWSGVSLAIYDESQPNKVKRLGDIDVISSANTLFYENHRIAGVTLMHDFCTYYVSDKNLILEGIRDNAYTPEHNFQTFKVTVTSENDMISDESYEWGDALGEEGYFDMLESYKNAEIPVYENTEDNRENYCK